MTRWSDDVVGLKKDACAFCNVIKGWRRREEKTCPKEPEGKTEKVEYPG
jgi:hypothetical protein